MTGNTSLLEKDKDECAYTQMLLQHWPQLRQIVAASVVERCSAAQTDLDGTRKKSRAMG
eukprot:CAMPEP_0179143750 /NCGR_PEP_ID=MMETSP0796-20121207/69175_1 /TAXON_ID=73915 /ORGANISM="Pyrodinium bahamense, Strain pbaha01" /LENGTH=58 /DNA_ID=CAMNT_0020843839 /DNA_START=80 /DNA_END=254 /DNA_ORIENTATION=+